MANVLIRDIDPADVERLKALARSRGRSMQAEARAIIEAELEREKRKESFWEWADDFHRRVGRSFEDSAPMIAGERERGYRDED